MEGQSHCFDYVSCRLVVNMLQMVRIYYSILWDNSLGKSAVADIAENIAVFFAGEDTVAAAGIDVVMHTVAVAEGTVVDACIGSTVAVASTAVVAEVVVAAGKLRWGRSSGGSQRRCPGLRASCSCRA